MVIVVFGCFGIDLSEYQELFSNYNRYIILYNYVLIFEIK